MDRYQLSFINKNVEFFGLGKLVPRAIKPHLVRALDLCRQLKIQLNSIGVGINRKPIFVLGNQKSGTSAIAALLGYATGLSVTIDLKMEYLSTGRIYLMMRSGSVDFETFIKRNRLDFSREIIKEPNLTIFYQDLLKHFPEAKFAFVIRDPRQNIRSILNRLRLPGNLDDITETHRRRIKKSWNLILDGRWLGFKGGDYIEMLALRWNYFSDVYLRDSSNMVLVKYEEFLKDKIGAIHKLAETLGLDPGYNIQDKVNIQYQPRGSRHVNISIFFGARNLTKIETICRDKMKLFGYV